jgi:hypothetical protein
MTFELSVQYISEVVARVFSVNKMARVGRLANLMKARRHQNEKSPEDLSRLF